MRTIPQPVFCLTTDVDWATDFALDDLFSLLSGYQIRPTVFATHRSQAVDDLLARGEGEVGVHPNFLPGSTHGSSVGEIIDHVLKCYPQARAFRSHATFDGAPIALEFYSRGIKYDSNIGLHLQPNLTPLRHATGVVRFPIFWEDDAHWHNHPGDWNVDAFLPAFLSPGLKVLNVHPFFIATNCPNQTYYEEIKPHITTLSAESLAEVRYEGEGARTFLCRLLDRLTDSGARFHMLSELFEMFPMADFLTPGVDGKPLGIPR